MVVHIVFWRLHERSANGLTKHDNAREMKRRFERLAGVIPGLIRCVVGIDFAHTPDSADVALYSEFESRAAFDAYQPHPAHQEIVAFLKDVRTERRVVDYEV
ncbi:MAG TPA: Dabb family protein [Vicinamibacterales bacterium]|nr:Dabb family protein [Vicinamibacterales bacterium]